MPTPRRHFLKSTLALAGTAALVPPLAWAQTSPRPELPPSKRDRLLGWLAGQFSYTPAAFFMHFGDGAKVGLGAARRHQEFFRATEMDYVKIQYEQHYTPLDWLQRPEDWAKLEVRGRDFYEPVLVAVRELVKELKAEALIVMTLYSPFMWAGHVAGLPRLLAHMKADPEAVRLGLNRLVESQMIFVKECLKLGVDGFYMSTQGSETGQFDDPRLFRDYVRPTDLVAMQEAMAHCPFNILHVCDYNSPYASYAAVADYPGHVVNCSSLLDGRERSWTELESIFRRPMFGGLEKNGVISKGTPTEIAHATRQLLDRAPARFMVGAECTIPFRTPWENIRTAIRTAHEYSRG